MRTAWVVVFVAVLLTGCGDLPSVEGIATKENTVFDPALVGAWNAGDAVIIVQAGEDKTSYAIHWVGAEGTETPRFVRMEGTLVKLGEQRVLDLTAARQDAFSIPCHVFLRIRPADGGLKVQFIDSKWIREQARSLPGFVQDGHPVLTAPAVQVEGFLRKFGFEERALDDPILLKALKQK